MPSPLTKCPRPTSLSSFRPCLRVPMITLWCQAWSQEWLHRPLPIRWNSWAKWAHKMKQWCSSCRCKCLPALNLQQELAHSPRHRLMRMDSCPATNITTLQVSVKLMRSIRCNRQPSKSRKCNERCSRKRLRKPLRHSRELLTSLTQLCTLQSLRTCQLTTQSQAEFQAVFHSGDLLLPNLLHRVMATCTKLRAVTKKHLLK